MRTYNFTWIMSKLCGHCIQHYIVSEATKTVAGRVAIDTGDLARPLRQTRYSDLGLSFTALAARTDAYKYSFFPEQYVIGIP